MYKNGKWTPELDAWIWQHRTEGKAELYNLFCEAFPDVETTINGIAGHRSEIGACARKRKNDTKRELPLYSEQIKKGYVRIKIAQPSVWILKSKWVWLETHPAEYNTVKEHDVFIFLDGNNRNFTPSNIEKVTRAEMGTLNRNYGGIKGSTPDENLLKIARARLKINTLEQAEKIGLAKDYGGGRVYLPKAAAVQRKRRATEAGKRAHCEAVKRYRDKMTPEQREHVKQYQHEYYLKMKNDLA